MALKAFSPGERHLAPLTVRQSIAPRIVDNSFTLGTLASTDRFSVRVGDIDTANIHSTTINPNKSLQLNAPICNNISDNINITNNNNSNSNDDESKVLATFIWKDLGRVVELAGSFDDWRKHLMEYIPQLNYHILVVELPPGEYYYRFVVDGRWKICESDENLQQDCFGEWSHFIRINQHIVQQCMKDNEKRFSYSTTTAVVSKVNGVGDGKGCTQIDRGICSDTSSSDEEDDHSENEEASDGEGKEDEEEEEEDLPLPPRQKGEEFVTDYDDDACGELDLQADVFEAMKDVKESAALKDLKTSSHSNHNNNDGGGGDGGRSHKDHNSSKKSKRGKQFIRQLFKTLFGKDPYGKDGDYSHDGSRGDKENVYNDGGGNEVRIKHANSGKNQKKLAMVSKDKGGKRGLKVWFPKEKNFAALKNVPGRKVTPAEAKDVVDVDQKAMFYNQVEENAKNRQLLGKTLYAQGKYDAALALFSLSVKLREDNGLRNAKTNAIAHTDVASAFIHLDDAKNAEKHLMIAKKIFERACFSGGKANLGDVHCFLGVVKDMTDQLEEGANHYRRALDLYEQCGAQNDNPNWATTIDNLKANLRRQKMTQNQKSAPPPQPSRKSIRKSTTRLVSNARRMSKRMSSRLFSRHQQGPQAPQETNQSLLAPTKTIPPSRPINLQQRKPPAQPPTTRPQPGRQKKMLSPPPESPAEGDSSPPSLEQKRGSPGESKRQSSKRRNTWRELAESARASMSAIEAAVSAGDSSYEGLSRQWQRDGREKMANGQYIEAKDILTLAIYTRKRHGPWKTLTNAECHEDLARVLFALSCDKTISKMEAKNIQKEAAEYLKTSVEILQDLEGEKVIRRAGEIWGNLGLVLDRMGDIKGAETAHTRGIVCYGCVHLSQDDPKWKKAYRNWKKNLDRQGKNVESKWNSLQTQIAEMQK